MVAECAFVCVCVCACAFVLACVVSFSLTLPGGPHTDLMPGALVFAAASAAHSPPPCHRSKPSAATQWLQVGKRRRQSVCRPSLVGRAS
eukprot:3540501-Alexandrium_andersonii.AAC.1